MRKLISNVTAICLLATSMIVLGAACLATVAQASPHTRPHTTPGASSHRLGDASIDGFKAWQSGPVDVGIWGGIPNYDPGTPYVDIPIKYNKEWSKTHLSGYVGVKYKHHDKPGWWAHGVKTVISTGGADESYTVELGIRGLGPVLYKNTTYDYYVYIEYAFKEYAGPTGTFTTPK